MLLDPHCIQSGGSFALNFSFSAILLGSDVARPHLYRPYIFKHLLLCRPSKDLILNFIDFVKARA